jgi:Flp pilus assembly pilin Flp
VELRNRMLMAQLVVMEWARAARRRARTVVRDEAGQTPTEYLMIVGLMAAAIIMIFVTFFWDTIRDAASSWAEKVADAVMGEGID